MHLTTKTLIKVQFPISRRRLAHLLQNLCSEAVLDLWDGPWLQTFPRSPYRLDNLSFSRFDTALERYQFRVGPLSLLPRCRNQPIYSSRCIQADLFQELELPFTILFSPVQHREVYGCFPHSWVEVEFHGEIHMCTGNDASAVDSYMF